MTHANHPTATPTLFDQFLRDRAYLKNVTPATLTWYRVAFNNYHRELGSSAAAVPSKAVLTDFVLRLRERGVKPVTVNTNICAMNAYCAWLHAEGHSAQPVRLAKLLVEKRVLTLLDEGQLRRLINLRPRTFRQARTHLAVCLILDTGLRITEALNLRESDIDLDNFVLRVFGKGQKERLVPFSPELRARLFRYGQLKRKKVIQSDLLFAGFQGSRWEKRNSTTSLHLLLRTLGLPRFGWHRLRHTFATSYLRHGGDVVRLSRILGHTQISTTQRYLHLLTEDLTRNHQRVSILGRLG